MAQTFMNDFETEISHRLAGLERPDSHAWALWRSVLEKFAEPTRSELVLTCEYAASIPYAHAGLSAEIYFAHPLRVAAMAGLATRCDDAQAVKIGLLHNALEVGQVSSEELANRSSPAIAAAVQLLTVDRSQQWDPQYKERYYQNLLEAPLAVRAVKVMDKLDNVFLLPRNPDEATKKKYRAELEKHVLPLALTVDREIHAYMARLIEFGLNEDGR